MEVLSPGALEKERMGILVDGLRRYPRALPLRMLRLFRIKFGTLEDAQEEIRRVKVIEKYLAPDHLAWPEEFLVDYSCRGKGSILLCGLQEYVAGEVVDPWSGLDRDHLISMFGRMGTCIAGGSGGAVDLMIGKVREMAAGFTDRLKGMIADEGLIPDLAGAGNLIMTCSGAIKLVDINNTSRVSRDSAVHLDDRGYPVCDKSVEALFFLERKLAGRASLDEDPLYRVYLDPERMKKVKEAERRFHLANGTSGYYPTPSKV
jgi:hypothetical protein